MIMRMSVIKKIKNILPMIALYGLLITPTFATVNAITSDDEITANIQQKISQDRKLYGVDIKISTQHGIVTLNGKVDDEGQADEVVKIAKSVPGVQNVN